MKTTLRWCPCVCAAVLALPVWVCDKADAQSSLRPPEFNVDPAWPTIPND